MPGVVAQTGAQTALNALTQAGTTLYLALLTSNPATSGVGGGNAVNVSDLVEVTTSGYSRASVIFTTATAALPTVAYNTTTITWGPMTGDMLIPAQWIALVTSASGTSGSLLYTNVLDTPEQVSSSQVIQIATDYLTISFS